MRASGKTTKTLVWVLMGLLIFGLAGFGITNLGGAVRSVGEVGEKPITTESYSRALRQTLQGRTGPGGRPLTFAEAREQQLDRMVLSQLIATRSLDHETAQLGISVGDEQLARQILQSDDFKGLDGTFSRPVYQERLRSAGLSEREFETIMREEMARGLVETAVFSDVEANPVYAETVVDYIGARRDFTWSLLTADDLDAPLPEAGEAELKAYFEANPDDYMRPATRAITYAWITPEMVSGEVEIDEETLRQLYDERGEEFNRPERRLVERLIFTDDAAAEAAKSALDAGETSFEALVEERGLELADVDMGDVTLTDLDTAGKAVFSAESGDIVGPAPSPLGPALFRVNAVIAAQEVPFEDVRAELRGELAQGRARRLIETEIDTLEDLLAAGATLEELAAETPMELGTIGWHERAEGGPAGYAAFRAAADSVQEGDFPELITLDDGGLIAIRLDGEEPAALRPFEEVRTRVREDERRARLTGALSEKAEALAAELGEGRAFTGLEVTPRVEEGLTRSDVIEEAPAALIPTVFGLESAGHTAVVSGGDTVALVQLDGTRAPDMSDPDLTAARSMLGQQIEADLAQDMFQMYVTDIQARTPVTLDQAAINAVNAQFQ
ncbi:peptidylprolyl isomerase [Rhodobacteraceae bacterium 63075]|nr:peptidylprolyl isomerase [Rhodobacteraceae bacterium 63075]